MKKMVWAVVVGAIPGHGGLTGLVIATGNGTFACHETRGTSRLS